MSDASRIGDKTEMMLPMPIGAASGTSTSARSTAPDSSEPQTRQLAIETPAEHIITDSAEVSLAGMLISQASRGSDVRFEKVASLRQAILAGVYRISAADVAQCMMEELQRPTPSSRSTA